MDLNSIKVIDIKNFIESFKVNTLIELKEALDENNRYFYKAKRWLEKKRPEIPDSFHGKPEEQFVVTIREIYTEAIIELKKLAMRQQISNRSK